jgi:drug/metabolite transporter (DMT)-like permease
MKPWMLWTGLAVIGWGLWSVMGRVIGDTLSPSQSQALSTLGLAPVIVALACSPRLKSSGPRLGGILLAFSAGLLSCLGNVAYYEALNRGAAAAVVVPLTAMYPLVTILLAVVALGEQLNRIQMGGIVLSMVAIYLFNVPQAEGMWSSWLLVAAIPILLWGISGLLQKLSTNRIPGELSALWFLLAFVPVSAALLARDPVPGWASFTPKLWISVFALGFTFAAGNYAILRAFALDGKAAVIAPLGGLYPVVGIPIAVVVLQERIGWREGLGIAAALLSVAALAVETPPSSPSLPPTKTLS